MKCTKLVLLWWLIENIHHNTLPVMVRKHVSEKYPDVSATVTELLVKSTKLVLLWWWIEHVHHDTLPLDGMEACI